MKPDEHVLAVKVVEVKIPSKIELCKDLSGFLQGWPTMGKFSNEGVIERFGELVHQILG